MLSLTKDCTLGSVNHLYKYNSSFYTTHMMRDLRDLAAASLLLSSLLRMFVVFFPHLLVNPAARVVVSSLAMQLVILPHPDSLVPVGKVEDAVTILLVVLKVADVSVSIRPDVLASPGHAACHPSTPR